ncbi:MAG: formate--tetrahydrofolate ligase, partial [Candidatus Ratteibacteria bacterium]
SGLKPDCVVIVCSIRALKMHSGQFKVIPGKPLDKGLIEENLDAIKIGSANLVKHIENVKLFGIPAVVAINRFTTDTEKEIELVRELALSAGAKAAEISNVWAEGGNGGLNLAKKVLEACEEKHDFHFLYPLEKSIKEKIEIIATKIYGAEKVSYSPVAEEKIKLYTRWGFSNLPICMAKTHLSLSHDPNLKGAPKGFTLPIEDVRLSAGAGFIYPLCGKMRTMPGLPTEPAGTRVDIDEAGKIVGLF